MIKYQSSSFKFQSINALVFGFWFLMIGTLSAAPTGQSGNAHQSYLKALLLESQGNYAAARVEVDRALEEAPESAFLHRTAAELSLRLGQVSKAAEEIERSIEIDPKDVRALIIAGQIHWALGDSEKAEARLRKALSLDPDEAEALISLAGAVTPKDPKEAIRLYKDFLARHPNEVEIQERLAQVYQSTNDLKRAGETWEDVLALSPNSVRAHLSLAQIAEINFDTATAISHYEGVLTQDPTNLPLLLRVGELRYRSNDMANATEAFTKAQAVAPNSPGANFWLALLAENRGDWKEAIRLLKNIPDVGNEPGVLLRLSYYYSQAGEYDEAVKVLKRLSDSDPANTDFLNYLAVAYEQAKQSSNAEKTFRRILEIDPNDAEAHFHLATLYDRTKRFPKAEVELRAAIRLRPDFHMALNYLGYSLADRNRNLDEAEKLVADAIGLEPHNPAYLDSMGWVYFRMGKLDKAKDFLREATERVRDDVIWDHYGDVLMAGGEVSEAILAWDEALRTDPKNKGVREKVNKAMKRIAKNDKIGLFVKRALSNFGDIESVRGLVQVTVCQTKPCAKSNAQFTYERNDTLDVEIPGPLTGPVMQLVKKHGKPAKYGALHPQFQNVEFFVTRAFDRIEPLLSAEVFKNVDLAALAQNPVEKGGQLTATSGGFQIAFDAESGMVRRLTWDDGEGMESLTFGDYQTPQSAALPKSLEWKYAGPSSFTLRLDFLAPAVISAATADSSPVLR